jgi:hypothetical protein
VTTDSHNEPELRVITPGAAPATDHGAILGPRSAVIESSLEDIFLTAGMSGIPAPTTQLAELMQSFANLILDQEEFLESDRLLFEGQLRRVEEARAALPGRRATVDQRFAETAQKDASIEDRERGLLADRAGISSQLVARRASYPKRIAEERHKAHLAGLEEFALRARKERDIRQDLRSEGLDEQVRKERQERCAHLRGRLESAHDRLLSADTRVQMLAQSGITRPVAGFLLSVGLAATSVAAWTVGSQLSQGERPSLTFLTSVPVALSAGVAGIQNTFGAVAGTLLICATVAATCAAAALILAAGDRLAHWFDPTWSASLDASRGKLFGAWAGGRGVRPTRASYAGLIIRLPLLLVLALFALLAMMVLRYAGIDHSLVLVSTGIWRDVVCAAMGIGAVGALAGFIVIYVAQLSEPRRAALTSKGTIAPLWHTDRELVAVFGLIATAAAVMSVIGVARGASSLLPRGSWALILSMWSVGGSYSLARGLVWRGVFREREVQKGEVRTLTSELDKAVGQATPGESSHGALTERLDGLHDEIRRDFESTVGGPQGILEFVRPTRRFYRTPQKEDTLDKATVDEYSEADARFEPELLNHLFDIGARLEALRAEWEHNRADRSGAAGELADILNLESTGEHEERQILTAAEDARRARRQSIVDARKAALFTQAHCDAAYILGVEMRHRRVDLVMPGAIL